MVSDGFGYQYFYRSSEIPIYMLLDRGTLGAGGNRASERALAATELCPADLPSRFA